MQPLWWPSTAPTEAPLSLQAPSQMKGDVDGELMPRLRDYRRRAILLLAGNNARVRCANSCACATSSKIQHAGSNEQSSLLKCSLPVGGFPAPLCEGLGADPTFALALWLLLLLPAACMLAVLLRMMLERKSPALEESFAGVRGVTARERRIQCTHQTLPRNERYGGRGEGWYSCVCVCVCACVLVWCLDEKDRHPSADGNSRREGLGTIPCLTSIARFLSLCASLARCQSMPPGTSSCAIFPLAPPLQQELVLLLSPSLPLPLPLPLPLCPLRLSSVTIADYLNRPISLHV